MDVNGSKREEDRIMNLAIPEDCLVCGMKTKDWVEENPDDVGWIVINMMPGISLFFCPKCGYPRPNTNIKPNFIQALKWQKEDNDRRIAVASGVLDPRTNKPVSLIHK